jgi:Fe-S-cluster containining protein
MQPQLPASAGLLRATIAATAPHIPVADNLGVTDDWRDLYYVLDYLCFAVDAAYPEIPCAKGCSHCCKTNLFRVTRLEWEIVKRGLAEMPADRRDRILADTRATFGPHRAALEGLAAAWSAGEVPDVSLHHAAPKACPMLIEGRCSAYAHRPAICRGYGYFSATVAQNASLLICQEEGPTWVKHLEDTQVDQIPMPNWNPIQRRIEALNPTGEIKPLPLWLLDEGESVG